MTLPTTLSLGAFSLGFLIGWLVYFMNRHRKGEVSLADLGVLVGIFAGSGVAGLLGGTPGTPMNPDAAGAYCIGLLAGFLCYLTVLIGIVRRHRDQFDMLYFVDGRRKQPDPAYELTPQARPFATRLVALDSGDEAEMGQIIDQAIADIDTCIDKLNNEKAAEPDSTKRDEIRAVIKELALRQGQLFSARTRLDFSRPDVVAAIARLSQLGNDLTTEAQRMKNAAAAIGQAAEVIGAVNAIIGTITKLAQ